MRRQTGKPAALRGILLLMTGAVILLSGLAPAGCSARQGAEEGREEAREEGENENEENAGEIPMVQEDVLDIRFLKCGKADAITVFCGGQTMVIDTGEEDDGEKLLQTLKSTGADHVDVLIITHFDKDHVGGADKLLSEMEVKEICLPDYEGAGTDYEEFTALLEEKDLSVTRLQEEISFAFGSAMVLIEPPASYEITDPGSEYDNNFSLITTITHGDNTLIFMGDAEKDRIREWLSAGKDRTCCLIKVPHHGVYNKAVKELAQAAKADYAVITDSAKNPADAKTLAAFEEYGTKILSTKDNTVRAVSDGSLLEISQ